VKVFSCAIALLLSASVSLLGGCASRQATPAFVPPPLGATSLASRFDASPPACKEQKTYNQYASLSATLSSKGGTVCIPAFGGFGGTVGYPPANPSIGVALISSTSNYNGKLPGLHSGKPIFYLQLSIAGPTSFGRNVPAGGGLTRQAIVPGQNYTAFAQAKIDGFPVNFKPCYTRAVKGKFGGVIGGVGTLLKGQNVPTAATGVIEIYAGKYAAGKC
jgi:hypothetical protein